MLLTQLSSEGSVFNAFHTHSVLYEVCGVPSMSEGDSSCASRLARRWHALVVQHVVIEAAVWLLVSRLTAKPHTRLP